jgi:hypothetical protein
MIQKRFSIPKRFLLPIIVLAVALAPWLTKIVLATPAAAPRTRAAQVSDWQRIWRGEGFLNDLIFYPPVICGNHQIIFITIIVQHFLTCYLFQLEYTTV